MKIPLIIAFGIDFRDKAHRKALEEYLDKETTKKKTGVYEFTRGKIQYDIRMVFSKKEFLNALETPRAIVIYDGHSRFGQGPAFVEDSGVGHCPDVTKYPDNPWEDHVRMGWDAVKIPCVHEILEHCTNPKEYNKKKAPGFAPGNVRRMMRKAAGKSTKCKQKGYAKRKLLKCFPSVANKENGRGVKSLHDRHYWYTDKAETDFFTIVQVGAADLRKSKLKCSVLFLNSCSSLDHYYCPLRQRKKETKSKCVFYLTRRTAYMSLSRATNIFVDLVLKEGVDPTRRRGRKRLVKEMNKVNPGILKKHKIKNASGLIDFFTTSERRKTCPSW